jgi:hypothetical protein
VPRAFLWAPLAQLILVLLQALTIHVPVTAEPAQRAAKQPIKVAVFDTGLNVDSNWLCEGEGMHFDAGVDHAFSRDEYDPRLSDLGADEHGHGTRVAEVIRLRGRQAVVGRDYCFILIKAIAVRSLTFKKYINAWKHLAKVQPDLVNGSFSGPYVPILTQVEGGVIRALKGRTIFVLAAGNDGADLDKDCFRFPQCQKESNLIIVGGLDSRGERHMDSNYGSFVTLWRSFCVDSETCGTSFSAPQVVGELLDYMMLSRETGL